MHFVHRADNALRARYAAHFIACRRCAESGLPVKRRHTAVHIIAKMSFLFQHHACAVKVPKVRPVGSAIHCETAVRTTNEARGKCKTQAMCVSHLPCV